MRNLDFEQNLLFSLKKLLGRSLPKSLGVAVSGGADSVSLLWALSKLEKKDSSFPKIFCVTVDHSIRAEKESSGDAAFVQELCGRLGFDCFVKKIGRGLVTELSSRRKKGIEEAARFLRYQKFEEFAKESGVPFVCLAHNQNDALETLLMRFLQGSSSQGAAGMAAKRGLYLRPLLGTSREKIEEYLRKEKVEWRTDSTNQDNNFFRNRIRNLLIPFLDENFEGWKKALLAGSEKAALEDEALDACLTAALNSSSGEMKTDDRSVSISKDFFSSLERALRQRLLYRALDSLGADSRLPYSFVKEISLWPEIDFKNIHAAGFEASSKKGKVFIKKSQKEATESGFFDIIERGGTFYLERSPTAGDKF